ncbi:HPF/RaiA family ribosome-associated protein [Massilia oculi]|jgi:ribosomal subunit interface protein|uniref:Ribosomal subunit interface protein n=2 Tax=Massilia TaxID=149698 RepID=A0A422QF58_9BURK|nr:MULTISPECIES: HPF/RaiA family ribosome-associated protein [Massilia]AWL04142.1 ribosomal subunit interface protein [Massilia oculi]MDY0962167.1 HPF/RaiA family ribosome-associated protein [Massilia sp. CFBP9026]RNF28652.1 ribosomal subunit interface protein [Massilia aurea]
MQINVNTDNTINKHQGLDEHVQEVVRTSIGRFGDQVNRVDVHLSNENKEKKADGGNSCMLEARLTGIAPIVIHEHATDLHQAINNAGGKLARALDSAIGRLQDKQRAASITHTEDPTADKHLTDM